MRNTIKSMKTFKAILLTLGVILSTCCMLPSCQKSNKQKIVKSLEALKSQLPIDYGYGIKATNVSYDENNDLIVCEFTSDESLLNIKSLKNQPGLLKKAWMMTISSNLNSKAGKSFQELVEIGVGVQIKFLGTKTKDNLSLILSSEEIKKAFETPPSDEELLDIQVQVSRLLCPQQVDEMTSMNDMCIDEHNLIYIYTIPGDISAISDDLKDELKKDIKEELISNSYSDPITSRFINLVRKCNKNLVYSYRGTEGGKIDVVIPATELSEGL